VGVVEDGDIYDLGLTWGDLKDLLRQILDDGASLLPALLAVEVPLLAALLHLLLPIFRVPVLAVTHLAHEFFHHVTEGRATSSTMAASTAAATTTASAAAVLTTGAESLHHLVDQLHGALGLFLLGSGVLLFEHGNHDVRGTSRHTDLEEGMLVAKTLFAGSAEVEVLADTALVAQASDWASATAVARHILMDNFSVLGSLLNSRQIIGLKKFMEDLLSLLFELAVNEVLEGLPGDALDLVFLVILVASGGLLELHLLVIVHHGGLGAHLGSVGRLDGEGQLLCVA